MAKKKVNKKEAESIHVKLDSPVSKRKNILRVAVDTVEILKRFDEVKGIRVEKEKELTNLKNIMKSLNSFAAEVGLREMPVKMKTINDVAGISKEQEVESKAFANEKQKVAIRKNDLDSQLDALRRKIQSL